MTTTTTSTNDFDIVNNDPYLKEFEKFFTGRFQRFKKKIAQLDKNGDINNFANGHNFFGCHKTTDGWIFREWAPNATEIFLVGEHSNWKPLDKFSFKKLANHWELHVEEEYLHKGSLYRLLIRWNGGEGERIPAYATHVVQDEVTKIFSARIWTEVTPYEWKNPSPTKKNSHPIIYEAHVGMAQEAPKVGSYKEFQDKILPRIVKAGYNTLQLMAVQEHPYYGSFGYHVSNFFAASSRFGNPEELKELIDTAHGCDLYVVMDLIHSHAVKNEIEGIAKYDGTEYQFFHKGNKGNHPAWDSKCFDYGKNDVLNFLLSNCKYWLEEYHFDGFRFDGITSMMYWSHGLNKNFMSYQDYYNDDLDADACVYLMLANTLIHSINSNAITIAEDMSGMPGLATPIDKGGFGFDFRLAMGVPDYWIKLVKEHNDEEWNVNNIFYELTNRRDDEQTLSYVESHDQALVGDKTMAFRLMDKNMYTSMSKDIDDYIIDRGIALHKMIRLFTFATADAGYLNFMGNEFGHPEWIDFPREGNNNSYQHCRRQWSLVDNNMLKYQYLADFDIAMLQLHNRYNLLLDKYVRKTFDNEHDQVIAFERNNMVFVFNFNPVKSYSDYKITCPAGEYITLLDTDDKKFGGFQRNNPNVHHFTKYENNLNQLHLYVPARTGQVLILYHK